MRELQGRADIAHGVHARVGRAQAIVDRDAFVVQAIPARSSCSPSMFGARPMAMSSASPACSDSHAVRSGPHTDLVTMPGATRARLSAFMDELHAVLDQRLLHDQRGIRIVARQHTIARGRSP